MLSVTQLTSTTALTSVSTDIFPQATPKSKRQNTVILVSSAGGGGLLLVVLLALIVLVVATVLCARRRKRKAKSKRVLYSGDCESSIEIAIHGVKWLDESAQPGIEDKKEHQSFTDGEIESSGDRINNTATSIPTSTFKSPPQPAVTGDTRLRMQRESVLEEIGIEKKQGVKSENAALDEPTEGAVNKSPVKDMTGLSTACTAVDRKIMKSTSSGATNDSPTPKVAKAQGSSSGETNDPPTPKVAKARDSSSGETNDPPTPKVTKVAKSSSGETNDQAYGGCSATSPEEEQPSQERRVGAASNKQLQLQATSILERPDRVYSAADKDTRDLHSTQ